MTPSDLVAVRRRIRLAERHARCISSNTATTVTRDAADNSQLECPSLGRGAAATEATRSVTMSLGGDASGLSEGEGQGTARKHAGRGREATHTARRRQQAVVSAESLEGTPGVRFCKVRRGGPRAGGGLRSASEP
eukprot:749681-Rhodomonas_salina.6